MSNEKSGDGERKRKKKKRTKSLKDDENAYLGLGVFFGTCWMRNGETN